jgi:hypothetical protein
MGAIAPAAQFREGALPLTDNYRMTLACLHRSEQMWLHRAPTARERTKVRLLMIARFEKARQRACDCVVVDADEHRPG